MTTKTLHGPNGLRIKLDSAEIFPDDPGQGTPAMVNLFDYSATYWCAADTGELSYDGRRDRPAFRELTSRQLNWLQSDEIENAVNSFVMENSPNAAQ